MSEEQPLNEKQEKQRTLQQNKALHLYFQLVADSLNNAGLDMKTALDPEVDIPWTKQSVKEYLWKPIQQIQLQKGSTTELTTKDIDWIYDTLNRYLATHGIHEPFPSIEEIINRQREGNYPQQ